MKLSHIEEYALHVDTSGINDVVICFLCTSAHGTVTVMLFLTTLLLVAFVHRSGNVPHYPTHLNLYI